MTTAERVYVDFDIVHDQAFQEAIQTRIECGDDFRAILNLVCGVITSWSLFGTGETIGDGSLERMIGLADSFELTCFDMLAKFEGDANDFRFTFMDTWVLVDGLYRIKCGIGSDAEPETKPETAIPGEWWKR